MTGAHAIEQLLSLEDDDLLALLGAELLGKPRGAEDEELERQRGVARRWLESSWSKSRDAFCSDPRIIALMRREGPETVQDVTILIDVLAALVQLPTVATLAVILTKRGLRTLCGHGLRAP